MKLVELSERVVEAGWLAALVATPILFDPYAAQSFEPEKIALVRGLALVMLLAWVAGACARAESGANGPKTPRGAAPWRSPVAWAFGFFLSTQVVATVASLAPATSLLGSYTRQQGLLTSLCLFAMFALVASRVRSLDAVERMVDAVVLASVPVGVYAVLQRWQLDPFPWSEDVRQRAASTLGTANFVAAYLAIAAPLTAARALDAWSARAGVAPARARVRAGLCAVCLALQVWALVLSQSRGPLIALLVAISSLGLLLALRARRFGSEPSRVSPRELARGVAHGVPLALVAALGGAAGHGIGVLVERALAAGELLPAGWPLTGGLLGAWLGLAAYAWRALARPERRRWFWISWCTAHALGLAILVVLNVRGTALDPWLAGIRDAAYVERLARLGETESGTGRIRIVLWDAALDAARADAAIGVPGDELAPPDALASLRPLVGFGPENSREALVRRYPPELFQLAGRHELFDRAHNETLDLLVTSGGVGAGAWLVAVVLLLATALARLGGTTGRRELVQLVACAVVGAALAVLFARLATGTWTFAALAACAGVLAGLLASLAWQAAGRQPAGADHHPPRQLEHGILAALLAHWVALQFLFSTAATAACFWVLAGAVVGSSLWRTSEPDPAQARADPRDEAAAAASFATGVAAICVVFAFLPPAEWCTSPIARAASAWGLYAAVLLVGLASAWCSAPARRGRAVVEALLLAVVVPCAHAGLHALPIQRFEFLLARDHAVEAARALTAVPALAHACLLALLLSAAWLGVRRGGRANRPWGARRSAVVFAGCLVLVALAGWSNLTPIRADVLAAAGARESALGRREIAIELLTRAHELAPRVGRHALALAEEHQALAAETSADPARRDELWRAGERFARAARRAHPYDPDFAVNLGRYQFAWAQSAERGLFAAALQSFELASALAPTVAEYRNLQARCRGGLGDTDGALARLEESLALDPSYPETWVLLGDVHAVRGEAEPALAAHVRALGLRARENDGLACFADAQLRARLEFHRRSGGLGRLAGALDELAARGPGAALAARTLAELWRVAGEPERALVEYERAAELSPEDFELLRGWSELLAESGQRERALDVALRALAAAPPELVAELQRRIAELEGR